MPNIPYSLKISILDNFSKKPKFKKNLSNFEFYAGRVFNWYHSHFSTMNISIGQNCLDKKPIWVYIPFPGKWGQNQKERNAYRLRILEKIWQSRTIVKAKIIKISFFMSQNFKLNWKIVEHCRKNRTLIVSKQITAFCWITILQCSSWTCLLTVSEQNYISFDPDKKAVIKCWDTKSDWLKKLLKLTEFFKIGQKFHSGRTSRRTTKGRKTEILNPQPRWRNRPRILWDKRIMHAQIFAQA